MNATALMLFRSRDLKQLILVMTMQPHAILITGGCGFIGSNFINYVFDRWPSTRSVEFFISCRIARFIEHRIKSLSCAFKML